MSVILKKNILKPFSSSARSAGSSQASSAFVSDDFSRVTLMVDATAVAGTPDSWSLNVKVQISPDTSGDRWLDLPNGAITPLTAVGQQMVFDKPLTGARRVRVVYTLAFVNGTAPTLAFEVDLGLSQV